MSVHEDMTKSEMLRRSMRCFVLGWWSLVPILGVVPAALAFVDFRAVVIGKGRRWNAGRTRLLLGAMLAGFGLLLTVIIGVFVTLSVLSAIQDA